MQLRRDSVDASGTIVIVETSLAETLINAIAHGRIRGVQLKRGWSDERATAEDLNKAIDGKFDGIRAVVRQEEMRRLYEDNASPLKIRADNNRLLEENRRLREQNQMLQARLDSAQAVTND